MTAELKPCPMCGGNAHVVDDAATAIHVRCSGCGLQLWGHKHHFGNEAEATSAWNTRALTAPAQVPITYGCHCDLAPGEQPDGCVLDEDRPQDCMHARSGKTKATCQHWLPIGIITQQEAGK